MNVFAGAAKLLLRDLPRLAIGVVLLLAVGINAANIIGRYVFSAPLPWAEEVLSFLIIWGVLTRRLGGDLRPPPPGDGCVRRRLSAARAHASLRRSILAAVVGFSGFAAMQAWKIVQIMARNGQVSITAEIPMTVPYFGFVVGFTMIVLAAIATTLIGGLKPADPAPPASNET